MEPSERSLSTNGKDFPPGGYAMKRTAIGAALAAALIVALLMTFGVSSAKKYEGKATPWIGVYTQEIDEDLSDAFNLDQDKGIVVVDVVDDSPAEEAGLKRKDVIVEFNGVKVDGSEPLADLVRDTKIGDKVDVVVMRKGQKKTLTVEIGERPSSKWRQFDKQLMVENLMKNNLAMAIGHRGYMGVTIQNLNDQLGEYFGVKNGNGVLITGVSEDSPAEKAGLKAGDVIIKADDEEIVDSEDIFDVMSDKEDGDTVIGAATSIPSRSRSPRNRTRCIISPSPISISRYPAFRQSRVSIG